MARIDPPRINSADLNRFKVLVKRNAEELKSQVEEALDVTMIEAANDIEDILENATTRTGRKRERDEGGFPGRHETGNMISKIGWQVRRLPRVISGFVGWWGDAFEEYFYDQDAGVGNIPAARALPQAAAKARENLRRRLANIAAGKPMD